MKVVDGFIPTSAALSLVLHCYYIKYCLAAAIIELYKIKLALDSLYYFNFIALLKKRLTGSFAFCCVIRR
jgi:hypothetical protein